MRSDIPTIDTSGAVRRANFFGAWVTLALLAAIIGVTPATNAVNALSQAFSGIPFLSGRVERMVDLGAFFIGGYLISVMSLLAYTVTAILLNLTIWMFLVARRCIYAGAFLRSDKPVAASALKAQLYRFFLLFLVTASAFFIPDIGQTGSGITIALSIWPINMLFAMTAVFFVDVGHRLLLEILTRMVLKGNRRDP